MSKTKQGVKNLNDMGPKRPRKDREDDFGMCLVGVHSASGKWTQMEDDNYQVLECSRCGVVLASNGEEMDENEKV